MKAALGTDPVVCRRIVRVGRLVKLSDRLDDLVTVNTAKFKGIHFVLACSPLKLHTNADLTASVAAVLSALYLGQFPERAWV
jgi:hypothetical protein